MDARAIKNAQRRAWEANAPGWQRHWGVRAALQPVTDALVELAGIGPGRWVLDVATGLGEPALDLARRVGPTGKVVGIDFSETMIANASARARAENAGNASFHVLDLDELFSWPAESYDSAVCRFGLVYLPEIEHSLGAIRHVLTPEAPLASAVWAAPQRVPFIQLAKDAIHRVLGVDGPDRKGLPHAFALSERGALEQRLASAGFGAIRGESVTVVIELASAEEYLAVMRDTTRLGALIESTAPEKADEAWAAVAAAAEPYRDVSGKIRFPCEASCVVGFKA